MTNLNEAREWAKHVSVLPHLNAETQSAIKLIQSLPDHWVDAKSVQEIIDEMNRPWGIPRVTDLERGTELATEAWKRRLEALLTPKLPTLADMTQQEREACQWMQANLGDVEVVITYVLGDAVQLMDSNGWISTVGEKDFAYRGITPLPDLPKLEWPAQESPAEKVTLSGMWVDDGSSPVDAIKFLIDKYEELDRLNPEDVPANEPWLIEADGQKAVGARYAGNAVVPWAVAALDGSFAGDYHDSVVTLIHKLVPEPPALPEGMRLADHEEYGRVVVSRRADSDGDYRVFYSNDHSEADTGASWKYADENEFTFLNGGS